MQTPEIVLVHTQLPQNLGLVSRSMLNFILGVDTSFTEFSLNHEKIKPLSAGADIVIDKMKVFSNFHDAVKKFNVLIGTTNRTRTIKKTIDFEDC